MKSADATAFRMTHILCEEVRPEERKKLALLGVFTGERLLLGPSPKGLPEGVVAQLASLCIVSTVFLPAGSYATRTTLVGPDGQTVFSNDLGEVAIPDQSHTIISRFAPFAIKMTGQFVMRYEIGAFRSEFPFGIEFESKPTT